MYCIREFYEDAVEVVESLFPADILHGESPFNQLGLVTKHLVQTINGVYGLYHF